MHSTLKTLCLSGLLLLSTSAMATTFKAPSLDESLLGNIQYGSASSGDTITAIAKRYDVGYNIMESANPHLNLARPFIASAPLQIPTHYLLPNHPRQGIVVNLPEMRLYYYPAGTNEVRTYPIGIGKIGKNIPIAKASIIRKTTNPTWIPPQDIREFNLEQGVVLPRIMPPGPDNPLGQYAIYLSLPTYLMHSTIFPESIGRRASFGCIRMYESDIEEFFPLAKKGIPVLIVNEPFKLGWQKERLYAEAHQPLEEHATNLDASLPGMVQMIAETTNNQNVLVDWQLVSYLNQERDGLPHEIGMKIQ